jgi:hypothetical protein
VANKILAKNVIARRSGGAGPALVVAAMLLGCAAPVDTVGKVNRRPKLLDCSRESLARLGSLDVAIAIDNSLSTQHPAGFDVDRDGTVGGIKSSVFTDRGDSWLGAQIAAVRRLIRNASDYDVRFSIITYSGYPFLSHRKRSTRAVGDSHARIWVDMTGDVAALESALDDLVDRGSDGSASFYAGVRRASQSLIESQNPGRKRRKVALFISDTPGPVFHAHGEVVGGITARMAVATREAKRNDIVFNSFGLTQDSETWRRFTLGLIGPATGGRYHSVENPKELYCYLVASLARR